MAFRHETIDAKVIEWYHCHSSSSKFGQKTGSTLTVAGIRSNAFLRNSEKSQKRKRYIKLKIDFLEEQKINK